MAVRVPWPRRGRDGPRRGVPRGRAAGSVGVHGILRRSMVRRRGVGQHRAGRARRPDHDDQHAALRVAGGPRRGAALTDGARGRRKLRPPRDTARRTGAAPRRFPMNWTLEVVIVPVSDIDRAKEFYAERLGFTVYHDTVIGPDVRLVQLTPPGSGCSIVIGKGAVPDMPPGSLRGLQLVVLDLAAARAQLVERGVQVSEIQVLGQNPTPTAHPLDNVGFVFFTDPDGNGWGVQQ